MHWRRLLRRNYVRSSSTSRSFTHVDWSRLRARDYYDLWRVMGAYRDQLDLSDYVPFLREKCVARNVSFEGPEDFFQEAMLSYVKRTWNQWLGRLVPGLPSFETVIGELRPQIEDLITQTE